MGIETKLSANQKIEVSVTNTEKEPSDKLRLTEIKEKSLIELRKAKFGTRLDILTGEEFVPLRKTQKFANSTNRTRYHNEVSTERNLKILTEFKNSKYNEEQKSNWQDVLFYLLSLNEQSPSDKISFLMTKYSIKINENQDK